MGIYILFNGDWFDYHCTCMGYCIKWDNLGYETITYNYMIFGFVYRGDPQTVWISVGENDGSTLSACHHEWNTTDFWQTLGTVVMWKLDNRKIHDHHLKVSRGHYILNIRHFQNGCILGIFSWLIYDIYLLYIWCYLRHWSAARRKFLRQGVHWSASIFSDEFIYVSINIYIYNHIYTQD